MIDTRNIAPGTYFLYSSDLNYLTNDTEDLGGIMTEIVINAARQGQSPTVTTSPRPSQGGMAEVSRASEVSRTPASGSGMSRQGGARR